MSEAKLVILGAGGHGKVCAGIAFALKRYDSIAFSDNGVNRGTRVLQWAVEYHDAELPGLKHAGMEFVIGLGQTGTGAVRERLYDWLQRQGVAVATLTSMTAIVSSSASIGAGTVTGNLALIQASATVGRNCIVNSRALVEHDASIGSHVHLATGSIVNGGCAVGDRSLIGSGAVVNHGIVICADAIVGSGAVVTGDIDEPGVYIGVPARKVRSAR
jgi:sugar O-acyltransferase (sialic acid O-acetyltransferase NeuD family)